MISINDKVVLNGIEWTCWSIDKQEYETFIHLINDEDGICIIESELKNK